MASTDASDQAIEQVLLDAMAELGPAREDIKPESTFEELDLDSLDLVEVAQIAEETWGAQIDPQDFANVTTVGEALTIIKSKLRARA